MINTTATQDKNQQNLAFQSQVKLSYEHKDSKTKFPNKQIINIFHQVEEDNKLISQLLLDESDASFSSLDRQSIKQIQQAKVVSVQQSSQQSYSGNQVHFFQVIQQSQQWSKVNFQESYDQLLRQYRYQFTQQYWSLDQSQDTSSQQQLQAKFEQNIQEGSLPFEIKLNFSFFCSNDIHLHQENKRSSSLIDDALPSNNQQDNQQRHRYIPPPKVASGQDMKRIYQQITINQQYMFIGVEGQHDQPSFLSQQFQDQSFRGESSIIPFIFLILAESNQE